MAFGKYNLRTPGVNKYLKKANDRAKRLNGPVVIVKAADSVKLAEYRKKQRERRKNGGNLQ
jgi:hypothetical protein